MQAIVHFVMRVLQGQDFDSAVKQSAGQTLINVLEFRPKLTAKKSLVAPILTALMTMIAQENPNAAGSLFSFTHREGRLGEGDGDEDDDESFSPEMDVQRLAQTTIDCMAINIPSKYFVDTALGLCAQGMHNPDPQMRKAGCAVLGVIAEGCCDKIRATLAEILPPLLQLVRDSEYYVRECACFALGKSFIDSPTSAAAIGNWCCCRLLLTLLVLHFILSQLHLVSEAAAAAAAPIIYFSTRCIRVRVPCAQANSLSSASPTSCTTTRR